MLIYDEFGFGILGFDLFGSGFNRKGEVFMVLIGFFRC